MPDGMGGSSVSVTKGSTFAIRNADGDTVLSAEAPFDLATVFYSSADLTDGGSYTLLSGTNELSTSTAASGEGSTGSGGAGRGDMQRPGPDNGDQSNSLLVICLIAAGASLLIAAACITVLIVVLHRRKKAAASAAASAAAPTAPADQSSDPKENG